METKKKINFFSLSFGKNFFKKVFLVTLSFLLGTLISFSYLQFLDSGSFYFSKITLFFLFYFFLFILAIEAILFKKTLLLAGLSIINTFSLFWLYFLEKISSSKNLFFFSKAFLIESLLIIIVFFLFFLGKISIKRKEKLLVNFSFLEVSSPGLFYFSLALTISFALIFNFSLLSGKFLWLEGIFHFFKIDLKSSSPFGDLISKFYQDPLIAKNLESYLNKNLSFKINFEEPISQVIFKIFEKKEPFKLLLSLEVLIFLVLFSIFSLIRFLVKIFGGIIVELLIGLNLIKKSYKNISKETIGF